MLAIVATSVVVEALQYFVIVGRDGSIRDCVSNAVGGIVAYFIAPHVRELWRPSPRAAPRLAWGGALLWIAHAAFALFAFRPSMTDVQLYAQVAAELGQFDVYRGLVGGATVNGAAVYSGPFPGGMTAEALGSEPLELSATITTGAPTRRLAPILSLFDGKQNEIAVLGEHRGDLVYRTRVRAEDFGLRVPVAVIGGAVTPPADGSLAVRIFVKGVRNPHSLDVSATRSAKDQRTASLPLTPTVGWMLWWPFDVPGPRLMRVVIWFWLALPLAVIAFWSMSRPVSSVRVGLLPATTAMVGAHVLVPLVFRAPIAPSWFQFAAQFIGASIGLALGASRKSGSDP